jgi:hypothetical protein
LADFQADDYVEEYTDDNGWKVDRWLHIPGNSQRIGE